MSLKKKSKKKSKGDKYLRQANMIVSILISRWTIKDDDDEDNDDDDNDNDEDDDNENDDDEDNDRRKGRYNNNNNNNNNRDFRRILEIVFYDFSGILKGF